MDCSLPGSSVHGIFQARILEWVAIPSSKEICIYSYTYISIYICIYVYTYIYACAHAMSFQSCPTLCNPMDCSPPGSSMGFSRQEYWSGFP